MAVAATLLSVSSALDIVELQNVPNCSRCTVWSVRCFARKYPPMVQRMPHAQLVHEHLTVALVAIGLVAHELDNHGSTERLGFEGFAERANADGRVPVVLELMDRNEPRRLMRRGILSVVLNRVESDLLEFLVQGCRLKTDDVDCFILRRRVFRLMQRVKTVCGTGTDDDTLVGDVTLGPTVDRVHALNREESKQIVDVSVADVVSQRHLLALGDLEHRICRNCSPQESSVAQQYLAVVLHDEIQ